MISHQLLSHQPEPHPLPPNSTMTRRPQALVDPMRVLDWVTEGEGGIDRHKAFDNIPKLSRG